MNKEWFRERLASVGRTQAELARHMGLDASAVSRLLKGDRQLKGSEAAEVASFLGCAVEDVLRAFGVLVPERRHTFSAPSPVPDDGFIARPQAVPQAADMPRNLPVYGAAIGGDDGAFEFNGQIHEYIERPPQLAGVRNAYGVYVTGDSMMPRFEPGWLLHINPNRPVTVGASVVVQVRPEQENSLPLCYIKEFVRRTPTLLVLRQYNPPGEIEWPLPRVIAIHRVVGIADM